MSNPWQMQLSKTLFLNCCHCVPWESSIEERVQVVWQNRQEIPTVYAKELEYGNVLCRLWKVTGPLPVSMYKQSPWSWRNCQVVRHMQALGLWRGKVQAALTAETRPSSVSLLLPWTCLWLISLQILRELMKGGPCHCLTGTCLLLICSSGFSEPCRFPTNY